MRTWLLLVAVCLLCQPDSASPVLSSSLDLSAAGSRLWVGSRLSQRAAAQWEALFGELSLSQFLERHWEREYLHLARDEAGSMDWLLSPSALDLLLDSGESTDQAGQPMGSSDVKFVRRTRGPDGEWWTGELPMPEVSARFGHSAFRNGFTMVLNRLNARWGPAARLCTAFMEEFFGFRTQANVYFTPGSAQGFEAHFDWMEAFVFQVQGEKHWALYSTPIELPRADQKFKPKGSELGPLRDSFTMRPGDVLYMPSGLIHEALTSGPAMSLHVTIGVEIDAGCTWTAVLVELARSALDGSDPLPPCAQPPGQPPGQPSSHLQWRTLLVAALLEVASRRESGPFRKAVPWRRIKAEGVGSPRSEVAQFVTALLAVAADSADADRAFAFASSRSAATDSSLGALVDAMTPLASAPSRRTLVAECAPLQPELIRRLTALGTTHEGLDLALSKVIAFAEEHLFDAVGRQKETLARNTRRQAMLQRAQTEHRSDL